MLGVAAYEDHTHLNVSLPIVSYGAGYLKCTAALSPSARAHANQHRCVPFVLRVILF